MALIDEDKLQGNVIQILQILKSNKACCTKVASTTWATSSIAGSVFVLIFQDGSIKVLTAPGGTVVASYGTLTHP